MTALAEGFKCSTPTSKMMYCSVEAISNQVQWRTLNFRIRFCLHLFTIS